MSRETLLLVLLVGCTIISQHVGVYGQALYPALNIGDRVVRGPHWDPHRYNGVTPLGAVKAVFPGRVEVVWDCGTRDTYQYGEGKKYEVQLALKPGDMVVRGPHWNKGNEDGHGVGKVTSYPQPQMNNGIFRIRWANGREGSYGFGQRRSSTPSGTFEVQRYTGDIDYDTGNGGGIN